MMAEGARRVDELYAGALATFTTLWFPPLLGGFVIMGLVLMLVRLNPRFRAYDADEPTP